MTVKHWFRLLRASEATREMDANAVVVFFRREFVPDVASNSPWSPAIDVSSWQARRTLIDDGVPEHPQIIAMQMIQDRIKYGPSADILQ